MEKKDKKSKYLYSFEIKDNNDATRNFGILKPNRKLEDAEFYYASKLSQFVAAGILPKILWDKLFKDKGGIISDSDKKDYTTLFMETATKRAELEKLSVKAEADRSDLEKKQIPALEAELVQIRREMQDLEMTQVNAYENTAESKSRNKVIVWWAANLAVEENELGKSTLLLGEGDIEEKLDIYDEINEDDEFLSKIFNRINYLVTVWYLSANLSEEDFKSLDLEYQERENPKVEKETPPVEVPPIEPTSAE